MQKKMQEPEDKVKEDQQKENQAGFVALEMEFYQTLKESVLEVSKITFAIEKSLKTIGYVKEKWLDEVVKHKSASEILEKLRHLQRLDHLGIDLFKPEHIISAYKMSNESVINTLLSIGVHITPSVVEFVGNNAIGDPGIALSIIAAFKKPNPIKLERERLKKLEAEKINGV